MNLSPNEAEEALAAIQKVTRKTRHSIASSGSYIFLIVTGVIWLVGFLSNQFLPPDIAPYLWIGVTLPGCAVSVLLGLRLGRRVRSPSTSVYGARVAIFWLLLAAYSVAAILIARPTDGKQLTMLIILFLMIGQLAIGLLFSFTASWWALPITALALIGYFLTPALFYLWMALLGGGGMIALGLYIHSRW